MPKKQEWGEMGARTINQLLKLPALLTLPIKRARGDSFPFLLHLHELDQLPRQLRYHWVRSGLSPTWLGALLVLIRHDD